MKYSMIKYNMRYGIVQWPVVTTRLLLKLELNRELMLLPLNLFIVWFFKEYSPTKIFAPFSWYKEIFFRENIGIMLSAFLQEYVCIESLFLKKYFPRKLFHLTLCFQKIFPKKTFLPHSLFQKLFFQEIITRRHLDCFLLLPLCYYCFARCYLVDSS